MDIAYRPYDESRDYAEQRALFRLSFPEAIGTEVEGDAHYRWKFHDFPASPPSYEYLGSASSEMVGYYAAIPFAYRVDGEVVRCGMVCDVMTHPEYRGQGIFTRMGRYATGQLAESGLAFTTGYPIRPEVIPGHLKVGWQIVETMPTYVRPVSVESLLPKALAALGRLGGGVLRALQAWTRPGSRSYTASVYGRDEFLSEIGGSNAYEHFRERWEAQVGNALIKDAAFLEWRTGAPGTTYRFVVLRRHEELIGMAIVRPTRLKGIESLAVLDFMVLPDHLDGCRTLHWTIFQLARSERKDLVACMAARRWAKTYRFASSCYLRTGAVFSLIVKKLHPSARDETLFVGARWHTFWIDSDDL